MPETPKNDVAPTFEEAMDELDGIVEAMEGDRLSLAELIEQYARGMKLEKICRQQLAVARQRVDTITESADGGGDVEAKPFDPVEAAGASQEHGNKPDQPEGVKGSKPEVDEEEDDEIRLF